MCVFSFCFLFTTDGSRVTETAMADGTRCGNDNRLAQQQRDGSGMDKEARKERIYLKEVT